MQQIYITIMERNLLIELLEDGDKVSLYSPHFDVTLDTRERAVIE